jgi:hypothetical protein
VDDITTRSERIMGDHPIISLGSAPLDLAQTVTSITARVTYILYAWGLA